MSVFTSIDAGGAKKFLQRNKDHWYRDHIAGIVGDGSVYDLGCGPGIRVSELYTPSQYMGFDCSLELVLLAKENNPGYWFEVFDIRKPATIGGIDFAILASVLEHQENLEDALSVYRSALVFASTVIVLWHTPPRGKETILRSVYDADIQKYEPQNTYPEGSFETEGVSVSVERLANLECWVADNRGLRSC